MFLHHHARLIQFQSDQNGQNLYTFSDQNGSKITLFGANPPREGFDCCMQVHCIQCQRINIPKSVERFENSQYPFKFFFHFKL